MKPFLFLTVLSFIFVNILTAADSPNPAIEKRAAEIMPFLPKKPFCVGKPITDRAAWENISVGGIIKRAEQLAETPIPEIPESLYKEYYRNGNRSHYEGVFFLRSSRISTFTLAECIENKGRFIIPLEAIIRAVCAAPSWVLPAHDSNGEIYDGKTVYVDLYSSAISAELGLAVSWLGDKLSPDVRKLILDNVERRTFVPYEGTIKTGTPRHWWITGTNNWNAVCSANTVTAALTLIDDPQRRAWYIASAERSMEPFFRGFTPDGYCNEGIGYWNYGFGHFVYLAEAVFQTTGGKVDFFTMPKVRNCSLFAFRMEVTPGQFAAFADCSISAKPDGSLAKFLSRRLALGYTEYEQFKERLGSNLSTGIFCFPNSASNILDATAATTPLYDLRSEFPDAGVMIFRPALGETKQIAAVCKAGHNAENHNHNDVGSFTVMYAETMPVLDPGGEIYTQRTFSGNRYKSNLLNSFGHPVPVINGKLQQTGRKFEGKITAKTFSFYKDSYTMDIAPAYGLTEIEKLERTFEFTRTKPGTPNSLTVTDNVELEHAGTYETALITYETWKQKEADGKIELVVGAESKAVCITVSATNAGKVLPLKLEPIEINEGAIARKKPTRLGFKIDTPVDKATVVMTIMPQLSLPFNL